MKKEQLLVNNYNKKRMRLNKRSLNKKRRNLGDYFIYAVVVLGAFTMVLPFLWMVSTSLKSGAEVLAIPPTWIPHPVRWVNYVHTWNFLPFGRLFTNSLKISGLHVFGALLSSSLAAYGFARFRFPGRDFIFLLMLGTMMIPMAVTLVPVFILYRMLNWVNTHLPLIIPGFFGTPFGIFLLRQFFLTIPNEIEDAAKIDGANPFVIYWKIMLPLIKPALATLGVFTFMWSWNDFLGPIVYISSLNKTTVTAGLSFFLSMYEAQYSYLMAGSTLSIIPMLLVYFFAQRYFVAGITLTGLKS